MPEVAGSRLAAPLEVKLRAVIVRLMVMVVDSGGVLSKSYVLHTAADHNV